MQKSIGIVVLSLFLGLFISMYIALEVRAEEYADRPITSMDEEGNICEVEPEIGLVQDEISTFANTNEKIVNFNTKGNAVTEYVEFGTNESGYTNGAFGADAAYLGESNGKIKFMLSGVIGLVDKGQVQVINKSSAKALSYYTVSNGWLVHKIVTNVNNGGAASSVRCGKAPSYLSEGGQYFSYDGNYFYRADSFGVMLEDYKHNNRNNAINAAAPYFNYFQYLPLRSTSNYSASVLDSLIIAKTTSESKMRGIGDSLKKNQDSYGVNAILTAGVAANESGWGNSYYAKYKNNLFGIAAVDSNPDNAIAFPNVSTCIKDFMETYMSKRYLNPQNWVYYGAFLGNKGSGINVKYASDPYWGEKAAAHAWNLDDHGGSLDQFAYSLGIKDPVAGVHQDINVRAASNLNSKVLYTTGSQSNVAFLICDKNSQSGFYQVQSDGVLNASKSGIDNNSGKYDFNKMRLFVSTDYISIINEGNKENGNSGSDNISGIGQFQDINGGWFYEYVKYVYDRGIMTGLNQTTFGPTAILSRGQFATILYRMAGQPNVSYSNVFPDVPQGAFFTLPVLWAYNNGIITGYNNGYFGPPDLATREQIATLMYRYAKSLGYDTSAKGDINVFPDTNKVSGFAKEAMVWAVGSGIIKGDQGKLNPQGRLSRAQCATIITRFMELY
ncbi:S-layer homology domain-containing protein [Faecalicatena sp. AGMB00832]|uniref:S-layer homology domain-containing protein n=1 Tax=Faecalicatena faecalis TaxID=2726362 RepID=A0ABS6CZI0_9FIRM|nr:S-layer homology domain-containing protein [Faecalicatena faecalis]